MKNKAILIIAAAVFMATSAIAQPSAQNTVTPENEANPEISFGQETYDFGKIERGTPVTASFSFTNDGKVPLIINDVRKSCGCTKVTFPREPVLPGKSGIITATYNAASPGNFMKRVTVIANTAKRNHVLTIKGEVQKAAAP